MFKSLFLVIRDSHVFQTTRTWPSRRCGFHSCKLKPTCSLSTSPALRFAPIPSHTGPHWMALAHHMFIFSVCNRANQHSSHTTSYSSLSQLLHREVPEAKYHLRRISYKFHTKVLLIPIFFKYFCPRASPCSTDLPQTHNHPASVSLALGLHGHNT